MRSIPLACAVHLLVAPFVLAAASCSVEESQDSPAAAGARTASATLAGGAGTDVEGMATFTEADGGVRIEVAVEGVAPGRHGLHLHETGDCSAADFSSAGGHFNPDGVAHGAPTAPEHHAGDFGNLEVGSDGKGRLSLVSSELTVAPGPRSVVDRAVVVHADADDLASQPSGSAGARIACGVVR